MTTKKRRATKKPQKAADKPLTELAKLEERKANLVAQHGHLVAQAQAVRDNIILVAGQIMMLKQLEKPAPAKAEA